MKSWNHLSGDWQDLASDAQAPRYQVIAGMISEFCPRSDVLNVGCGEAVLWQYLPMGKSYFGIEPSAKAGESAREKCGRDCIINCTGEDFDAGECRSIVLSSTKCCITPVIRWLYWTNTPI